MSKHCALTYVHQAWKPGFGFKACCRHNMEEGMKYDNPEESLNSPYMEQLRQDLNDGIERPECKKCWTEEDAGKESMREQFNKVYPNVQEPKLQYLEAAYSNDCNLRCASCNSAFSTSWHDIDKQLFKINHNEFNRIISDREETNLDIDWSSITKLKLMGGEPFLVKKNKELLAYLDKENYLSQMKIEFSTNGTINPDAVIPHLRKTKTTRIAISIDGVYKAGEWLRYGSNYDKVMANVDKLREFDIFIMITTSLLNAKEYQDVINMCNSKDLEYKLNPVDYPEFLVNDIPKTLKYISVLDKTKDLKYKDCLPKTYKWLIDQC